MIKKINIVKINENKNKNKVLDYVAEEIAFNLYINKNLYVTLMSSPENLEILGIGFLFSEGIINKIEDIKDSLQIGNGYCFNLKNKNLFKKKYSERVILSGCSKGSIHYSMIESFNSLNNIKKRINISEELILKLMKEFNSQGKIFYKTGCVHRVSFSNKEKFIFGFDDIGRHNALDKNIGYALKNKISLEDKILFSTGRISSDLVLKANKNKIPLIISRTAPTSLAVEISKKTGMKLIGFVRGNRMNFY